MEIVKNLVNPSKYSIKCPYEMVPEFIVVHNTYNDASARNEISYMISNNNDTSFHYAIDDKEVVQGIPENRNAWHASDGGKGNGNRKGIAIEICYSESGGDKFIAAEKLAAKFIAFKLNEKGWNVAQVKKHQDFASKNCPHRTLALGWDRFLQMIQAELDLLKYEISYEVNAIGTLENKEKAAALAALLRIEGFNVTVTPAGTVPDPEVVPEPAPAPVKMSLDEIAKKVINGDFGNGHATREANLKAAGLLEHYTYQQVRNRVNELWGV